MEDFNSLKNSVLEFFDDYGQSIYGDESIALALQFALKEYSESIPHLEEVIVELTQTGNEVDLPFQPRLLGVRNVHYPWEDALNSAKQPINVVLRWYLDILPNKAILTVDTADGVILQSGKKMRVLLLKQHTLAGLEGAVVTTVPAAHFHIILQGTIGYLLLYSASHRGDVLDKSLCERLAQSRLCNFQRLLSGLAARNDRSQAVIPWLGKDQPIY